MKLLTKVLVDMVHNFIKILRGATEKLNKKKEQRKANAKPKDKSLAKQNTNKNKERILNNIPLSPMQTNAKKQQQSKQKKKGMKL